MNEICKAVADKIYQTAPRQDCIFYDYELFDVFPLGYKPNRETLESVLNKLKADNYIDIKFDKGNVFCIRGLKPYNNEIDVFVEKPTDDMLFKTTYDDASANKEVKFDKLNASLLCLSASLAGSLLGSILGSLIAILIS